jgi:undecaprenyl diphosphate synthase
MDILTQIDLKNTPEHIAIIMDGNGRWAQKQGQMRLHGHNFGVESVRETLKAAQDLKVKHLTLYAFSSENWNRPKEEVDGLMELLVRSIVNEVDELNDSGVRLMAIGDLKGLPQGAQEALADAMETTSKNTSLNLILALNYSSRWEIVQATKKLAQGVKDGSIDPESIDAELFSNSLTTKGLPDPELLIRTSGEYRISNFLLWQIAYSELYFIDLLWPDFRKEDLYKAVLDYQSRERRFGMVSEQIQKKL